MNRLENLRRYVDQLLFQLDGEPCRNGFVHLYGVSAFAVLLATARGVDAELAGVSGMLHDISSYLTGNAVNHAASSAHTARRILAEAGGFTLDEIEHITSAIAHHSEKVSVDAPLDEVLKDADVLQHHFYNPSLPANPGEAERLERCLKALAVNTGG